MKRILPKYIWLGIGLCMAMTATAQEETDATAYRAEVSGSASTGDHTPFWMTTNRYGVVPLDANNGYLKAGVFHRQSLGNHFRWSAGVDAVVVAPRYKNVYIQQLYAEIGYRCLELSIGSKERYSSMLDPELSTGDIIYSNNSRPLPEVRLSVPNYTVVPLTKGWLQFRGDFSVGKSFDTGYLEEWHADKSYWVKDVLWHYKKFSLQVKDTRGSFPFSASVGVQHIAQWGGTSTNPKLGEQPHSFKDFIRIVTGSKGGDGASMSDQINVLGNHTIGYDFSVAYTGSSWNAKGYYQHIASDKSGTEFRNGADGLWGMEFAFPKFKWIEKVVVEYMSTRNQSGPFHRIDFDHTTHPGRGGGGDNYYNNGEYRTGNSYFGKAIGSPLILSPEYNANHEIGFKNNRIQDYHFAIKGVFSPRVSYRLRITVMNGWGTHGSPFLQKKEGVSMSADLHYNHPKLSGWEFGGTIGADTGDMAGGKTAGFGVSVSKRGILKRW